MQPSPALKALRRYLEPPGTATQLAASLGIRLQTVSNWRRGYWPPAGELREALERATGGVVRARDWPPARRTRRSPTPPRPTTRQRTHARTRVAGQSRRPVDRPS